MWPKGFQFQWFRREHPRKEGPAPPHRPGFGQTELRVMKSPRGYYVGTAFVLSDGSDKPYTIESDYYETQQEAITMLKRMTGKMREGVLRQYIREICGLPNIDVEDALATAQLAHLGQKRRSGESYIEHPKAVAKIIDRYYPGDQALCAIALLHDTMEDAIDLGNIETMDDLSSMISASFGDPQAGQEAVRIVQRLTHEKNIPYSEYVLSLLGDPGALKIKLADMLHNLSSSPSMRQMKKYGDALTSLEVAAGGLPAGINPSHWAALQEIIKGTQNESVLRGVIRGMLVENFTQELQRSMLENDITDAVVDRLVKIGLFRRGIPVSIINRIEKHAEEILGYVYNTHHSIINAEEHGF